MKTVSDKVCSNEVVPAETGVGNAGPGEKQRAVPGDAAALVAVVDLLMKAEEGHLLGRYAYTLRLIGVAREKLTEIAYSNRSQAAAGNVKGEQL